MVQLVSALIVTTVYGLPAAVVGLPFALRANTAVSLAALVAAPVVYSVLFVLVAGLISVPFQKAIVPGKFPRSWSHPIYRARRIYGLCWTCVYYCKPVYFVCLSIPALKWLTFRLFGYRGSMDFTVYPDTWIRDLPLLKFGEGAYVSNRATLGTNIALSNGMILVDRIEIGRKALVGHLSMIAPGVIMGEESEVGVGCRIGIRVELGDRSFVNGASSINHHTKIGPDASIGNQAYLGMRVRVGPGIELPSGIIVPSRVNLSTQAAAARFFSAETSERHSSPVGIGAATIQEQ